ncbi:hypothetical protein [Mycolicibacterium mengxianglii]|uniref:hypothetical protein n=1 Tax=Mycolicibacterium mengxianglii TaxID=2736649 RepID=UPI0018EF17E0|nr:hypothetical protein [Mycolicibacterium mengxianglii]
MSNTIDGSMSPSKTKSAGAVGSGWAAAQGAATIAATDTATARAAILRVLGMPHDAFKPCCRILSAIAGMVLISQARHISPVGHSG